MKVIISSFLIVLFHPVFAQQWNAVNSNNHDYYPEALGVWNGRLFAGGLFTQIDGTSAMRVAQYSGNWQPMQGGIGWGFPRAFAEYNGELYCGGLFNQVSGAPSAYLIARWNGTQWQAAGNSVLGGNVYSLCVYNGELYAGGDFTLMGGVPCNRIAKWNGTNWSAVGSGVTGSIPQVRAMAVYNNELYVGGVFNWAGGIPAWYIARWNGTQWDSVGYGMNGTVEALITDTVNNLLYAAGGYSQAGYVTSMGVSKWDGNAWSPVGNGLDTLWGTKELGIYNNELYGGGGNYTVTLAGDTLRNFYKFNGTKWISAGDLNGSLEAIQCFSGNLYIAGSFTQVDTNNITYIACMGPNCLTVGTNNLNQEDIFWNIFPNPSADEITIQHLKVQDQGSKVRLMNNLGQTMKVIKLEEGSEEISIGVGDLSPGIYFVCWEEDGVMVKSKKLIITR